VTSNVVGQVSRQCQPSRKPRNGDVGEESAMGNALEGKVVVVTRPGAA